MPLPAEDEIALAAASARRASIVAAAGCGKTEQIALATQASAGKRLILTHTHAGVDALKARMEKCGVPQRPSFVCPLFTEYLSRGTIRSSVKRTSHQLRTYHENGFTS